MGWAFGWQSRAALVAELTRSWETGNGTVVTLRKAFSGNTMWTVHEHRPHDGSAPKRWIGCTLLRRSGDWGYKGMSEEMHPYYWSCPLAFLDDVPDGGPETCAEWRAEVRRRAAARARKLVVGDMLVFPEGWRPGRARVVEVVGRRVIARADNGLRVVVGPKAREAATVEAPAAQSAVRP